MAPLRVLFVGHTYVTGVAQPKLDALAATGQVNVGLLVPSQWPEHNFGWQLKLETPFPNIKVFPAHAWFAGRGGAYIIPPWEVWRALHDFRPEIIHVEQEVFSLSAFEMAVFARLFNLPLTIFCWENVDHPIGIVRKWTRQFVLSIARLIVAGNRGAETLLRGWGFHGPIEIMPQLGIDSTLFHPVENAAHETPIIGYVGRIVPQKGIDLLLHAARLLLDRGIQLRLAIVGSGPDELPLHALAEDLKIKEIIEWRGVVDFRGVPAEMARMTAFVLPSRSSPTWQEQFGLVLAQAMSMGIPVIGSSCGAIPEVIGRADVVFKENEYNELAKILENILRTPSFRSELIEFGLDRVKNQFTSESIAKRLIELFKALNRGVS
jgi:glycosyltransferase involved in cell wall biosynthesis